MKRMKNRIKMMVAPLLAAVLVMTGGLAVYAEPDDEPIGEDPPVVTEPGEAGDPAETPDTPDEQPSEDPSPDVPEDPGNEPGGPEDDPPAESQDDPEQSADDTPSEDNGQDGDHHEDYTYPPESSEEESYYEYHHDDYPEVYTYDQDNDDYEYSYEGDDTETASPNTDTSSLDISDYEASTGDTLTSKDWEKLRKGQSSAEQSSGKTSDSSVQTSRFEMSASATGSGNKAFDTMKKESTGGNDDWVYLAWGIVLIAAGVFAIAAVIFTSLYSKRKGKKKK